MSDLDTSAGDEVTENPASLQTPADTPLRVSPPTELRRNPAVTPPTGRGAPADTPAASAGSLPGGVPPESSSSPPPGYTGLRTDGNQLLHRLQYLQAVQEVARFDVDTCISQYGLGAVLNRHPLDPKAVQGRHAGRTSYMRQTVSSRGSLHASTAASRGHAAHPAHPAAPRRRRAAHAAGQVDDPVVLLLKEQRAGNALLRRMLQRQQAESPPASAPASGEAVGGPHQQPSGGPGASPPPALPPRAAAADAVAAPPAGPPQPPPQQQQQPQPQPQAAVANALVQQVLQMHPRAAAAAVAGETEAQATGGVGGGGEGVSADDPDAALRADLRARIAMLHRVADVERRREEQQVQQQQQPPARRASGSAAGSPRAGGRRSSSPRAGSGSGSPASGRSLRQAQRRRSIGGRRNAPAARGLPPGAGSPDSRSTASPATRSGLPRAVEAALVASLRSTHEPRRTMHEISTSPLVQTMQSTSSTSPLYRSVDAGIQPDAFELDRGSPAQAPRSDVRHSVSTSPLQPLPLEPHEHTWCRDASRQGSSPGPVHHPQTRSGRRVSVYEAEEEEEEAASESTAFSSATSHVFADVREFNSQIDAVLQKVRAMDQEAGQLWSAATHNVRSVLGRQRDGGAQQPEDAPTPGPSSSQQAGGVWAAQQGPRVPAAAAAPAVAAGPRPALIPLPRPAAESGTAPTIMVASPQYTACGEADPQAQVFPPVEAQAGSEAPPLQAGPTVPLPVDVADRIRRYCVDYKMWQRAHNMTPKMNAFVSRTADAIVEEVFAEFSNELGDAMVSDVETLLSKEFA